MRIITFLIALVVIAGLVIVFPFGLLEASAEETVTETAVDASALLSSEIKVTPEGKGLFTLDNFLILAVGFGGGYIISGIALRIAEKRKNESH
ncbi:MAG: hypothetical protein LBM59_00395 [Ruminococcus sp.]|nr:hypothetical protein [Ruminococcus sp.]